MIRACTLLLCLAVPGLAGETTVSARVDSATLTPGQLHEIVVSVAAPEGWTVMRTGGPPPIVQIKPPACAELFGKVLKDPAERSYKGYLYEPFERAISAGDSTIRFKLLTPPGDGDRFEMNVIGYAAPRDGGAIQFFRRRLVLPLAAGATATAADPAISSWSDEPILNIGDKLPAATLPIWGQGRKSLAEVHTGDWLVICTYRGLTSPPCQQQLVDVNSFGDEFAQRRAIVLAISHEDPDVDTYPNILKGVPGKPRFLLSLDTDRRQLPGLARVCTYLVDREGRVRQILPGTIELRPPCAAILAEIDRLTPAR